MLGRWVVCCACSAACVVLLSAVVATSADDGALDAREAVRAGRFVPLEDVVAWVSARYFGSLLEVELEVEEGDEDPPTYEVEWLTPEGNVIEFEFDARSGELLEIEGRGIEKARRR